MDAFRPARIQVLEIVGNAGVGGMENSVARMIERLPPERFAVTVLSPFDSPYTDRLRRLGAAVYITPMPEDPCWASIQLACALVEIESVDVLHSHLQNAHVLAGLVGRLTGKPVLATVHGRKPTALDLEVHRTAGTHLSVVCRPSYFAALSLGVNAEQLHFIPNGVDTDLFQPRRETAGALRRRFGIAPSARVVGFVGRLSPEKGPDVFLRMAIAMREVEREARFLLLGDGPMRVQLEGLIGRYGLHDNVHLAGMQADMPAALAELDVVVSTSHSEAMPLAIMEAMACGLPVVATQVGGVADLIQHDVTGWLAADGDHEGLASRVVSLLRDDAMRAQAGLAARKRALEQFALSRSVEQTARLLTELAQPPAEAPRMSTVARDGKLIGPAAEAAPDKRPRMRLIDMPMLDEAAAGTPEVAASESSAPDAAPRQRPEVT